MKNIFLLFSLLLFMKANGQKHDYAWILTHEWGGKGTRVDFNSEPPAIWAEDRQMFLGNDGNAFLCDEEGNLLAYTQGLWIANKTGAMMENGDSLNAGEIAEAYYLGYPLKDGIFFLPKPSASNVYYLFHMFMENLGNFGVPMTELRYTLLDFNYNEGMGKVVEKNIPLLTGDTQLNFNPVKAVRHANGRDWWLLVGNHMAPQYFRFLVTPDSILGPWMQEIGFKEVTTNWFDAPFNQGMFSPDGAKFADYDIDYIQIFDFDRCTGELSNPFLIEMPADHSYKDICETSFSPSGRFLYHVRFRTNNQSYQLYELVQYDLASGNTPIPEYIFYNCPGVQFECGWTNMLLAPNGKIYIASTDTTAYSIIHQPDKEGDACDFEVIGLDFPLHFPPFALPYFPNYRLYDIPESPCDTLGINAPVATKETEKENLKIYPNPASDALHLSLVHPGSQPFTLTLYDLAGQIVKQWKIPASTTETTLSLAELPNGLFFWRLSSPGQIVATGKLIILK